MTTSYFAGSDNPSNLKLLIPEGVNNFLWSFYYCKNNFQDLLKLAEGKDIFMDSGAYSAYTQGTEIDLDKYIDFLKENKDKLKVYANLDVIGDAVATKRNQELMEAEGLKPLPTYHQGEPIDYLIDMCKKYDYIALGGMVGGREEDLERFLADCFGVINNYPNVKVHGFGMTNFDLIKKFKFHSVDSTSWIGTRWGNLYEFDEENIEMKTHKINPKTGERFNLNIENNQEIDIHNIKEWKKASVVLENLWNNNFEQWSKEHRLKLSQSKQGNNNALKHGKFSNIEQLHCDLCKKKLNCSKYEEGAFCHWEKDFEGLKAIGIDKINEFILKRIEKQSKRLFRTDWKELADGGTINNDVERLEKHILELYEKYKKFNE